VEHLQSFAPGLLYTVAPENFSDLHLSEEAKHDEFDWEEYESELAGESFAQIVFSFLKVTAAKWGLGKN
jgi:hypothetical protein